MEEAFKLEPTNGAVEEELGKMRKQYAERRAKEQEAQAKVSRGSDASRVVCPC
jgi:hypothetical protein